MGSPGLAGWQQVLIQIADATADGARAILARHVKANTFRQLTFSPSTDKAANRRSVDARRNSILFIAHRGEHTQLFSCR